MEMMLQTQNLCKYFKKQKAVNNVSLNIEKGKIYGLLGPNGAGKSTFIKVITGVHKAEEGEMFLNGQKVDFKGPKDAQEAGIAAVPALLPGSHRRRYCPAAPGVHIRSAAYMRLNLPAGTLPR